MLINKKIPRWTIFKMIRKDMFIVLGISVAVYFFQSLFKDFLPDLPVAIPIFLGTAISLLLSFMLNQSYERWWEARQVWGSIVNDSRTLVLEVQGFLKPGNDAAIKVIAYRQIALCYSLGQSLRGKNAVDNIDEFLSEGEFAELQAHSNKALALMSFHSRDLARYRNSGELELFHHIQLDHTLVRLVESMGQAERIKKTVFPTMYPMFLHFLIYVFVIILSISLSGIEGTFEIPLLICIMIPFLLLEKTAQYLQNPFSSLPTDTPVTEIANTIEINLKQLIGDTNLPKPAEPNDYYID